MALLLPKLSSTLIRPILHFVGMTSILLYRGIIAILLVSVAGSAGVATYFYQQQNMKISQSSDLNNQVNQLQGQITALNTQITGLNKQIDSLNSQISQLQALNT